MKQIIYMNLFVAGMKQKPNLHNTVYNSIICVKDKSHTIVYRTRWK